MIHNKTGTFLDGATKEHAKEEGKRLLTLLKGKKQGSKVVNRVILKYILSGEMPIITRYDYPNLFNHVEADKIPELVKKKQKEEVAKNELYEAIRQGFFEGV